MRILIPVAALTLACMTFAAAAPAHRPLTVIDSIESSRAMIDRNGKAVFVSPDGARYAVMMVKGDVARDGVWLEILCGRLDSLENAASVPIARLFTSALGAVFQRKNDSSSYLVSPTYNPPVWIRNDAVGFFWNDNQGIKQVVSVNVDSREMRFLTAHPSSILAYAIGADGTLVYAASQTQAQTSLESLTRDGHAVTAVDAYQLMQGRAQGSVWDSMNSERFVSTPAHPKPRRIVFEGGDAVSRHAAFMSEPLFSPDEKYALYDNTVSGIPESWSRYTEAHFKNMLVERKTNPEEVYARQFQKVFVIDLAAARGRPLWAAPFASSSRPKVAWSSDSRRVRMGRVCLPPDTSDPAGLQCTVDVEVDVASGQYRKLPFAAGEAVPSARVRVEWREGLNDPPKLYAVDRKSGREQLLLDPNPKLGTEITLGRVEWLSLPGRDGQVHGWRLYYPVSYEAGKRYPLVIQTHNGTAAKDVFSLSSSGPYQPALGPGYSIYIAQLLANRDIFVLRGGPRLSHSAKGVTAQLAIIEEVARGLIAQGLVDPAKVGMMGHSASGFLLEYAIAHSDFPYAAAIADDNKDGSYSQAGFSNWSFGMGEEMIGAPAFGEGLKGMVDPVSGVQRASHPRSFVADHFQSGGSLEPLGDVQSTAFLEQTGGVLLRPRLDSWQPRAAEPASGQCPAKQGIGLVVFLAEG